MKMQINILKTKNGSMDKSKLGLIENNNHFRYIVN